VTRRIGRARAANALLLACSSAIALLLAEGVLRHLDPLHQRLRGDTLQLPRDFSWVIKNAGNPRLARQIVHTKNHLGFRGPDLPRDTRGHLLVFAVGGSTTECFYLGDGQDWPSRLGALLAAPFPRLWLNNAGLDGHSTFGHAVLLEQHLLGLKPHVLLFMIGVNDVGREDLSDNDRAAASPRELRTSLLTRLARHSALLGTVLEAWRAGRAYRRGLSHEALDLRATSQLPLDEPRLGKAVRRHEAAFLPAYRERVRRLLELCRPQGVLPVLMPQPALFGPAIDDATGVDLGGMAVDSTIWGAGHQWNGTMAWRLFERYNDVVRETGRAQGIPVIDLAHLLPKSSRFFYDTVHFTEEGAHTVARIVAAELCPLLAERFPDQQARPCPARPGLETSS
jgi:lysophospholipase L1-like esterase